MSKFRVLYARCYFGWRTRAWPWRVPWQVSLIGRKRPPEHVFEEFRRLHGIDAEPQAGEHQTQETP